MGYLFDSVRGAAGSGRVLVSGHADDMLRERGIVAWQVVDGVADGQLIVERPADKPNPVVEVRQLLPDGTPFKAVWGYVKAHNAALVITVHFFDR